MRLRCGFGSVAPGETMSSGTVSTGATFAALMRVLVDSPVSVVTPAGGLTLRVEGGRGYLAGPAELVGSGEFYVKVAGNR